ncbi:MAG: hypothetical protein V2I82_10005 [Halieaceae bacterium]|jgi:hypothetical protein|nr:hypothetical protein [Halieaceae bacterium]
MRSIYGFTLVVFPLIAFSIPAQCGPLTIGVDELTETLGWVRVREVISWPDVIDDSGPIGTEDGGAGVRESSVGAIVGDGPNGQTGSGYDGNYSAYARIEGPDSLPKLGVFAKTNSPASTAFDAYAEARALQSFVYNGIGAEDYSLRFDLDGIVSGDYLDYLSASILIGTADYNPQDPFGELGPATVIDVLDLFAIGDASETSMPILESGFLNFTLNPGDVAWLDITLSAVAQDGFSGGRSLIDASHTLEAAFTLGNTQFLQAGLPVTPDNAVPEPPVMALTAVGLLAWVASPGRSRRNRREYVF